MYSVRRGSRRIEQSNLEDPRSGFSTPTSAESMTKLR
jgi:hypothetical protein